MSQPSSRFPGNKAYLPAKSCQACGRPMVWRKKWRLTWHEVKFCSAACRQKGSAS